MKTDDKKTMGHRHCGCAELRVERTTLKGEPYTQFLPAGPYHDCEYVRRRNKLIPSAHAAAIERAGAEDVEGWGGRYTAAMSNEMDTRAALLHREFMVKR